MTEDAKRALKIYGPDIGHLTGKTTRPKAGKIEIRDLTPILKEVLTQQSELCKHFVGLLLCARSAHPT